MYLAFSVIFLPLFSVILVFLRSFLIDSFNNHESGFCLSLFFLNIRYSLSQVAIEDIIIYIKLELSIMKEYEIFAKIY